MPGGGIAPAIVIAPDTIGPNRGLFQRMERAIWRSDQRFCAIELGDRRTRCGSNIRLRNIRDDCMRVKAPGHRRGRQDTQQYPDGGQQPVHTDCTSYCSITHSSLSDDDTHCVSQSCSQTACIYAAAKPGTGMA